MDMSDTELLAKRARLLAAARPVDTTAVEVRNADRFLISRCGSERMAIRLTAVAEVYRPSGVTPLPKATPPVWGLASWRGRILTIVKTGEYAPDSGAGMVVVLAVGNEVFAGAWMSDVEEEVVIAPSDIHPVQRMSTGRDLFVSGITSDAVLILDIKALKAGLERETPASGNAGERKSTRSAG